jgi:hypothetical protein
VTATEATPLSCLNRNRDFRFLARDNASGPAIRCSFRRRQRHESRCRDRLRPACTLSRQCAGQNLYPTTSRSRVRGLFSMNYPYESACKPLYGG